MNILYDQPTPDEYNALRMSAGLAKKEVQMVEQAYRHSLFSVTVRGENEKLLGVGRIIGDGACYFQIVDVLAHPEGKNQGEIEETIMNELISYLTQNALNDANITVMSDVWSIKFYQKFGFELVYPDYYGMSKGSIGK